MAMSVGGCRRRGDVRHQHDAAHRRDAGAADHVHHHHSDHDARGEARHAAGEQSAARRISARRSSTSRSTSTARSSGTAPWSRALQTLESYFRSESRKEPQPEIHLRPDRRAKYGYGGAGAGGSAAQPHEEDRVREHLGVPGLSDGKQSLKTTAALDWRADGGAVLVGTAPASFLRAGRREDGRSSRRSARRRRSL